MRRFSQRFHLLLHLLSANSNYICSYCIPFYLNVGVHTIPPSAPPSPIPHNVVHRLDPALVNHGFRQQGGGSLSFPFLCISSFRFVECDDKGNASSIWIPAPEVVAMVRRGGNEDS